MPNTSETKLGITITKAIGNAVVRNKCKRIYREIFRLHKSQINNNVWIIFKAKKDIVNASYKEIEQDIVEILQKNNVTN